MRSVLFGLVLVFGLGVQAQEELASVTQPYLEEVSIETVVAKIVDAELSVETSLLSDKLRTLAKEQGAVFSYDGENPVISIDTDKAYSVYSGKSGYSFLAVGYLVPIYLSFPGSGIIEEVVAWLVVDEQLEMDDTTSTQKIILKNIVPFTLP